MRIDRRQGASSDHPIELLDSTGTYAPNEKELQIATLQTYSISL